MVTAPRNCRFLSLVVVELVLIIVSVILAESVLLEFRDVIVIRGFSAGSITTLDTRFGKETEIAIVIALFRELISQNKQLNKTVACNHLDDKGFLVCPRFPVLDQLVLRLTSFIQDSLTFFRAPGKKES